MALGGALGGIFGGGGADCLISTEAASAFGRESTTIWSVLLNAVLGIAAVYATYQQYRLLRDQYELARDYYQLAKRDADYYHRVYVPCEIASLTEACMEQRYSPDYIGSQNRMLFQSRKQVGLAWQQGYRMANRYNTGQVKEHNIRMEIARATIDVAAVSGAYRFEENKKLQLDELRWAHRLNMLNIGIKVSAQANAGLAASLQATQNASDNLASFFGVQADALSSLLGRRTFNQTGGQSDFLQTNGLGIRNFPGGFGQSSGLYEPAGVSNTGNYTIGTGLFGSQSIGTYAGGLNTTSYGTGGGIGNLSGWQSR